MKHARRILALLLCLILTTSPWTAVLSEEALEEVALAVEPEAAVEPEPEAAPVDPLPEAGEVVVAPDEPEVEADDPGADSEDAPAEAAPMEELLPEDGALPAEPEGVEGEAPDLFASEEFAPELFASAPADVALIVPEESADIKLGVGETRSIGATFSDENSYPIEYASDRPAVASVAADGTITALAEGEAHIALSSECGSASVTVTVGKAPTAIQLTAERTTLGAKSGEYVDSVQLSAKIEPDGAVSRLIFSSSDRGVATVDENGLVTAGKAGKATITAKAAAGGKKKTVVITVKKAPSSISIKTVNLVNKFEAEPVATAIKNGALTVGVNQPATLVATRSSGSAGPYGFRVESQTPASGSGSAEVLAVDPETGELTAKNPGVATVVAETYNHKIARCEITVKAEPTQIILSQPKAEPAEGNPINATLGVGGTLDLPAVRFSANGSEDCQDSYVLASENSKIAAIDAKKKRIVAKAAGDVNIVATNYSGLTAALRLHIQLKPTKVAILSAPRKTLGAEYKLGEETICDTVQIEAAVTKPAEGAYPNLTYSSSNKSVATVDEKGLVTAHKAGKATITAKSYSGAKASVTITVKKAPASIALSEHEFTLAAGDTEKVKLTAKLSSGSGGPYSFRVEPEDADAISFDATTGEITAQNPGTAKIVVETYNHKTDECNITVLPAIASLELSSTSATLGVDEKLDLPAVTRLDANGEETVGSYEFKYNSDYVKISKGQIIPQKVTEKTIITAVAYNGVEAEFELTIQAKPTSVKLTAPRKTMGAKYTDGSGEEITDKIQLTWSLNPATATSALRFSSNNKKVATVNEDGLVTALAPGKATITLQTYNGKKSSVAITVKNAPTSVVLSEHPEPFGVGETFQFAATLTNKSGGGYWFSSDRPAVAEIDRDTGLLTAKSVDTANITVETYNGFRDSREIEVKSAPDKLKLSVTEATLGKGESMDAPIVTNLTEDGGEAAGSYSYQPENTKYVQITSAGRIKALRTIANTNVVFASYKDGVRANLLLHIVDAPTKISLSADHTTLGEDEELQLTPTLKPATASSKLTYVSSKEEVATVSEDGLVTAIAPGTAKITVSTFNGKKASVTFTVLEQPTAVDLPDSLTLGLDEKYTIEPAMTPTGSGGGITYTTDDPDIAIVERVTDSKTKKVSHRIVALKAGSTTLHVKMYSGCEDSCRLTVKNAPTGIHLQDASFKLSAGDTRQLLPPVLEGESEDVASGTITYRSSNSKYVKVSATGLVTAVKAGKADITVSTYNNKKSKKITVTVKAAVKSVSFEEEKHRLFIAHSFTPAVKFNNGVASSYTLESDNPSVAYIAEDGITVCATDEPGTAYITATSYNGKVTKTPLEVWVPRLPTEVKLEPANFTLGEGDSATLRAVVPEGQGAEMDYASDSETIATVDVVDNETITVHAEQVGHAQIRVHTQNNKEAISNLTVLKAPTALSVSPSKAGRCIDEETLQLSWGFGGAGEGGRVEFSSSDESVATVDANGRVTFVKTGQVRITAKSYNNHMAACELTIGVAPRSMQFAQAEFFVALDDTVQLPVTFDEGSESYTLSTDNSGILSASGETVTAHRIGTATVTAVNRRENLRAECKVTVVAAPTDLELMRYDKTEGKDVPADSVELILYTTEGMQLIANPLPHGVGSVHFYSSDPGIAAVDYATGFVTPVAPGDCVIHALTYNGHPAECNVHVRLPLEGFKVGIDPGHQAHGNMSKESRSPKGGGTKYKCASSSYGVARVQEHAINLQVSLKLRDALERLGAEVVMTRETANVDVSNKQRALIMNNNHVDIALRIHCNAWIDGSAHGLSIIRRASCAYSNKTLTDYYGESYSGSTLKANEKKLGQKIANRFVAETGAHWRGLGTSDEYTMNNWSKVPCLLVELGFMTHPKEGWNLVKASYQQKMVKGIVKGICDYFGEPIPIIW